jgi:hypothetical protein
MTNDAKGTTAAPRKRAPTKAAPRPRKAATTTPATEAAVNPDGSTTIDFQGRSMRVHSLTLEQIGVWRRVARQFETLNEPLPRNATEDMRAARAKSLQGVVDRCLDIVLSVLVDEADQEWIMTRMLGHQLTFTEAVPIISLAIEAFTARHGDDPNQAVDKAEYQAAVRRGQAKARRRA